MLVAEELFYYYHNLKNTMDTIEQYAYNFDKKNKKNMQNY